jgi:hypothetical protein
MVRTAGDCNSDTTRGGTVSGTAHEFVLMHGDLAAGMCLRIAIQSLNRIVIPTLP